MTRQKIAGVVVGLLAVVVCLGFGSRSADAKGKKAPSMSKVLEKIDSKVGKQYISMNYTQQAVN
ncbi:MAG: hypothetical protein JRG91_12150, partial [Deltaproteobacteria bacterium]|nr:hypothetical protein [Deltaproteobacteria bacterium]